LPTPLSIVPAIRPAGFWIPTKCCGELDPGIVVDAHLLASPLLAEALVLLVPEAILFGDVGMLAVALEVTKMLAWVVFVGASAALGMRSWLVSVSARCSMVCCCVVGVVACTAARLTC
jgi:hypothetical protein